MYKGGRRNARNFNIIRLSLDIILQVSYFLAVVKTLETVLSLDQ